MIDARSLPGDKTIETDICIVGAGTAGLTLAKEFINQKFRVVLLESGGLKPDRETQALYQGENIGRPYFTLDSARARYFGGTTNRWRIPIGDDCSGVRMRPLDAIDFEKRDWVPHSGWPFDKSHLDPYYDRAQEICRITPATYNVSDWGGHEKTSLLLSGSDRVETVIFKFGSRHPFLDIHAKEIARASNISIYLHANVVRVETNETADTVTRLRVVCLEGNKFWVEAKKIILATGAIEIPRLLLSSNQTQSSGLGNQHDLVGRFFMEHPHFSAGFFLPSDPDIFHATGLYNSLHKVNGVPVIGKLGLSEKVIRQEKMLNHVVELTPTIVLKTALNQFIYPSVHSKSMQSLKTFRFAMGKGRLPDEPGRHMRDILTGINDIPKAVYRSIKKRVLQAIDKRRVRLFCLEGMAEQAPNPDSRVILGPDRDHLGQRRANLDWQLLDMDKESIIKAHEIIDRELRHSGIGRLFVEFNDKIPRYGIKGGWHNMGTTRMHMDPKNGVVDQNCKVHGISNLFISGPSVFPTGGYANPSLTIVALAVRTADHIKELMV